MAPERKLAEVRFLTVAEVASIMRVSKMTVYRLVHAGDLPAIRVGRSFRVPENAVHEYLQTLLHRHRLIAGTRPWRPGWTGIAPGPPRRTFGCWRAGR